ncbi:MAG: alpha/beta hydrolase [candidate division KSB1 bacterium]|nr:alpha/beta hydrolase [candidate division KSB1 bacterium]MDZ7274884.1 alpha/beta hydrolase [candidate division KSB1 bacterium]MDZ7286664.1 alpha/beta hydrolase [candidate division KSB1 bacterium]MDZ7299173.1 alpha/beta hydrolase [candidate division KSB1 bacterium]MDZ7307017.1 alpha/beta hydrolase [candidate division KSB1 bacterium]
MKAKVNGVTLAYDDHGKGLPVVLLHGFPLNRKIWEPQVQALAPYCRVITPDLRGHGESEAPAGIYTMATMAADVAALLQFLQCGPAVIAGHSMGGYILLTLYRHHPQVVKGLVLVSTRAVADAPQGRVNRQAMARRAEEEQSSRVAVETMLPNMMAPASLAIRPNLRHELEAMMAATSVNGIIGAQRGMAERPDSSDLLPRISVPTLIIAGTADALIPFAESQRMAQMIPGAELHLLADAGHLPSLEKPEEFTAVLQAWLQKIQ